MQSELRNSNFTGNINNPNPDEAIKVFTEVIYQTFHNCCPIKTKTLSQKKEQNPWITNIILSISHPSGILLENKLPEDLIVRFRNYVANQIRRSNTQIFYINVTISKMTIKE